MNTKTAFRTSSLSLLFLLPFFACQKAVNQPAADESTAINRTLARVNAAATTATATTICDYDRPDNELTSQGWTKVFEDNFDTDLSKWNIWTGGAFNNELQYYQAANLQVTNGNLVITARKQRMTGATTPFDATPKTFDYTSGRIECKTNVSANSTSPKVRMVARIKLPSGYGMWPAFWSYGDPWPTQGEIDFVEARGQEPTKYQTNYFYGKARNRNLVSGAEGYITADADLTTCYHIYEMVWEKNTLTSYLDNKQVEVKSGGYIPNLFGKTERITLNLAVGGAFFTNLDPALIAPGTMAVDYVKVFTSK